MKPIRIEEDRIVFRAVLDRGVPTITAAMEAAATKLCAKYDRKVESVGGNHSEVWYYVSPSFTEDDAEQIEGQR
jgi:hypothetical protein